MWNQYYHWELIEEDKPRWAMVKFHLKIRIAIFSGFDLNYTLSTTSSTE